MRRCQLLPLVRAAGPAALLVALLVPPARGGSLDVNGGAAFSGSFGLEITPGSACAGSETVVLDSVTVNSNVEACSFIGATNVLIDGVVDFTAGLDIALGNGFETAAGASFSAGTDPTLTRLAFVGDDSPAGENSYKAGFRLRLDDLTFGLDNEIVHLGGFSSAGVRWFELRLKRNVAMMENRLTLAARLDNGTRVETPFGEEVMVPAGYNLIEIDWRAGGGTGQLLVSLNGVPFGGLVALANGQGRIDRVEWGITDGEVALTGGNLDVDDFVSTD